MFSLSCAARFACLCLSAWGRSACAAARAAGYWIMCAERVLKKKKKGSHMLFCICCCHCSWLWPWHLVVFVYLSPVYFPSDEVKLQRYRIDACYPYACNRVARSSAKTSGESFPQSRSPPPSPYWIVSRRNSKTVRSSFGSSVIYPILK